MVGGRCLDPLPGLRLTHTGGVCVGGVLYGLQNILFHILCAPHIAPPFPEPELRQPLFAQISGSRLIASWGHTAYNSSLISE